MCINANWTRIRHWSAPERRLKDSNSSISKNKNGSEQLEGVETFLLLPQKSYSFLDLRMSESMMNNKNFVSYSIRREQKVRSRERRKYNLSDEEEESFSFVTAASSSFSYSSIFLTPNPSSMMVADSTTLDNNNTTFSSFSHFTPKEEADPLRGASSSYNDTPTLKDDGHPQRVPHLNQQEQQHTPRDYSRKRGFRKTSHFFFRFYNRRKFKFQWSLSGIANFLLLLLMIIPIQSEICGNTKIKIMGDLQRDFKALENCTIIEGHLAIYDIAEVEPSALSRKLSFPKLREITDFFIMYNANAFESLATLFPNLTVIRGDDLVMNYAFVVIYCNNLYEIGLRSLTHILRGGVRIEFNTRLCYVHTINWDMIVVGSEGFIHIQRNENRNVCSDYCRDDCPLLKNHLTRRACWTKDYCQRVAIPCEEGLTCYQGNDGTRGSIEKCSKECLGGCYGPSQEECYSCKHFLWQDNSKNYCRTTCPSPFLMFNDWICIDIKECRENSYIVNEKSITEKSITREMKYRIYNDSCIKGCPLGTQQITNKETRDLTCEKCEFCPKVCPGGKIRSLDDLHQYKECTHIDGDLSINLIGKSIVDGLESNLGKIDGLETNLGKIVNISGRLEITRTFSIVSLDFFRSLRHIAGIHYPSQEKYYSLTILENENIQTLFSFGEKPDIRVLITEQEQYKDENGDLVTGKQLSGKTFIHYNPKLCPQKIVEMIKESQLSTDYDKADISEFTNGDKAICSHFKLNISTSLTVNGLNVSYDNYQKIIFEQNSTNDIRALLRYEIHYRIVDEATYLKKNLTQFDGRDACGGDYWKIIDKVPSEPQYESGNLVFLDESVLVSQLQPYTYYALYVATLMIRDIANRHNIQGAQSDILYIQTLESKPSKLGKYEIEKLSYSSVKIIWEPPLKPNGIITHYEMNITREIMDHNRIMERPYCQENYKIKEDYKDEQSNKDKDPDNLDSKKTVSVLSNLTKCDCDMCKAPEIQNEYEKSETDDFHDIVLNTIFTSNSISTPSSSNDSGQKKSELLRKKRSLFGGGQKLNDLNIDVKKRESFVQNAIVAGSAREYIAEGLKHFGSYRVTLRACHEDKKNIDPNDRCSDDLTVFLKVSNKPGADDIKGRPILVSHNSSSDIVWLSWNPPQDPNELIVNYNIKIESKSKESTGIYCITAYEFIKNDYRYHLPVPGAYYVSVQAVSVYGFGEWSERTWVTVKGQSSSVVLYVMVPLVFIFILAAAVALTYFYYKKHDDSEINISSNPRYISQNSVYKADEWEVPRNSVELLEELGNGCFGMVHKGIFIGPDKISRPCAVKTVKKGATHHETITFLIEATVMKKFDTTHVVKLLGVVSDGQPHMVILEMMEKGDLRKYLISRRPENAADGMPPPTVREIYQMAIEIADGMAYISKQRVVHGDLAARNCMISHDLVVKIGDFGLSHDIYTKGYFRKDKGMMPVRWMSPEGIRDGVYSPMTDVWSFGIVIWEMVTLGENPYQGLSNDQVYRFIVNKNIMAEPKNCPPSLYALMKDCWSYCASHRPTFLDLCQRLITYANQRFSQESFFCSPEGQSALEAQEQDRAVHRSERANRQKEEEENAETPLTYPNGSSSGGSVNVTFAGGYPPSNNSDSNGGIVTTGTNLSSSSAISNGHLLSSSIPSSEFQELNRASSIFGGSSGSGSTARLTSKWNKVTTFMRMRNKSGSASGEA
ncbi:insulin receptor isoform X2 [Lepeophtheirus salmonis]|uniref:insulin receptor isoform X2 n=1 Tax=Lepeophtheirus salmonis TaxID=72036 RepID=UPI001AEA652B|nr:insulin receptor-like isoform X2 [Lepeophtheirus salmonis]